MSTAPPLPHDGRVTRVLLLPSPLLPRLVHLPFLDAVAAALRAATGSGCSTDVAAFPRPPADASSVLGAFRRRVEEVDPDLVLTHSNGGRFAALAAPGVPVVHVDAALPRDDGEPAPMAPVGLLGRLAGMADGDGWLPPWSRWWPEEAFTEVLPDQAARRELRAREHLMPLAYLRSTLGAPPGWADRPQAYLAFGDTYAEEWDLAGRHGWPVRRLEGAGHLHHLVDPPSVAATVVELAGRI